MKSLLTKLATFGLAVGSFFATEANAQNVNAKIDLQKLNTKENRDLYLKNMNQRVPNIPNVKGVQLYKDGETTLQSPYNYKKAAPTMLEKLPEDAVFPGEFEEVEGILVSFPYVAIDSTQSHVLQPFIGGYGVYFDQATQQPVFTPVAYYVPEFLVFKNETQFTDMYIDLINAIQSETTAYVVIGLPQDTVEIKKYAESLGKPLTNVKWISFMTNSFWFRDCGAIGFYYDNLDKVGLLDLEYYSGRPLDDDINYPLSDITGYPLVFSSLETEGGNILVDGYGKLFTSDQYYLANSDSVGQYVIDNGQLIVREKNPLSKKEADALLKADMNLQQLNVLPSLQFDGGTGHVDLYLDMPNENEMVFAKFSESQKSMTDYKIVNKNIDKILSLTSYQDLKFKEHYVPVPNDDNGLPFKTNESYAKKTRTYVNHLLVNKAIIQPVFNDGTTGDVEGDTKSLAELQKAYPGYKIIPIDMRILDGSGGSIHCITKQIPAKNPIRISHRPIQVEDYDLSTGKVKLTAEIKSNLELKDTKVLYTMNAKPAAKVSNNMQAKDWKEVTLTLGADGKYTATLEGTPNTELASIDYYISASTSAKTMTSPITAPNGFHNVDFIKSNVEEVANNNLMCYPNPARENLYVNLGMTAEDGTITVRIIDASGKEVYENSFVNTDSLPTMSINTDAFPAGSYIMSVTAAGKSNSGKFTIVK